MLVAGHRHADTGHLVSESAKLDRAAFDAKRQPKRKAFEIPEAGGTAYLRSLGGVEFASFARTAEAVDTTDYGAVTGLMAELVTLALVDENGAQIYAPDEVALVGGFPIEILKPLYEAAQEMSGFGVDLGKGSEKTASPDSSSGSAQS